MSFKARGGKGREGLCGLWCRECYESPSPLQRKVCISAADNDGGSNDPADVVQRQEDERRVCQWLVAQPKPATALKSEEMKDTEECWCRNVNRFAGEGERGKYRKECVLFVVNVNNKKEMCRHTLCCGSWKTKGKQK